jgi:Kae1-associated kinase Bud32
MQKVAQGAEAILWHSGETLLKERVKKGYRLPILDEKIRIRRTELEARLLNEARRGGVATPKVLRIDSDKLEMEWIDGDKVKDCLVESNWKEIAEKIAVSVAKLHCYNIIHGDLTTSNMIFKEGVVYFIDFGLGFISNRVEDKAVDLYLLYHSIEAAHWQLLERMWDVILKTYAVNYSEADNVVKTIAEIEKRGRYKER